MANWRTDLTETVDRLAGEPVLVIGSLPPAGRDLDLLVRPAAESAISAGLSELGFRADGRNFAGFSGGRPAVAELHPAGSWGLPEAVLERLFSDAHPLPGATSLAQPAPHHVLLICARNLPDQPWGLKDTQRARVEAARREDPGAFDRAAAIAPEWRVSKGLKQLRGLIETGQRPGAIARALARRERDGRLRLRSLAPVPPVLRRLLRRRERGFVIALSGLDGSGKSSQAQTLAEALNAAGRPSTVIWDSLLSAPRGMRRLAGVARRGAGLVLRGSAPEPKREPDPPTAAGVPVVDEPEAPERLANLGGWRGTVVSNSWGLILSAALGARLARATWPRILRGEVVVCDRYLLDAAVELRYFYGDRPFRPHHALLELLTPAPAGAFLLEVNPELAAQRKGEFSGAQNVRRAALYAELAERTGVVRVDGSRGRDEIAAGLTAEVWAILDRHVGG